MDLALFRGVRFLSPIPFGVFPIESGKALLALWFPLSEMMQTMATISQGLVNFWAINDYMDINL